MQWCCFALGKISISLIALKEKYLSMLPCVFSSKLSVQVADTQLCSGGECKGTCDGDSGGGLFCKISGRWQIAGIVSYGDVACDPKMPGVYTRLSKFHDWISDCIQDPSSCFAINNKLGWRQTQYLSVASVNRASHSRCSPCSMPA